MTIASDTNKIIYDGNGSVTTFPIPFSLPLANNAPDPTTLQVYTVDTNNNVTLLSTGYLVDTTKNQVIYPYNAPTTPTLPTGWQLILLRNVPLTQNVSLPNQGPFFSKIIEAALDKLTMISQQQNESINRTLKLAINVPNGINNQLPAPSAGMGIGWDPTGTFLMNMTPAQLVNVAGLQSEFVESTGYGIISGLQVSAQSTPNMSVQVAAGIIHTPIGQRYTPSAVSSITINTADATNPRIDLIYVNSSGVVSYITGTPASSPVAPSVPSGGLLLAQISVAANQSSVQNSNITDKRIIKPNYQNAGIVSVKDFGAKGDGVTDDTAAIQTTVNSNIPVYVPYATYLLNNSINSNYNYLYGQGTIEIGSSFTITNNTISMLNFSGNNCRIEELNFNSLVTSQASLNNGFITFNGGSNLVRNCTFKNLKGGGSNFNGAVAFFLGGSGGNVVDGNTFIGCPGSIFSKQPGDIFVNNRIYNPTDGSLVLNGSSAIGCTISNNYVYLNGANNVSGAIAVENGPDQFIITNNTVKGVKSGQGISCITTDSDSTISTGGIISNNIIDGLGYTPANPQAGINIGSANYYNILIKDNIVSNIGYNSSFPGTSLAIFRTGTNTVFENNMLLNTGNVANSVTVSPSSGSLLTTIKNNYIDANNNSRCVYFNSGNILGTVRIENNHFFNATIGIDTANINSATNFIIKDNDFTNVTNPLNFSASIFGNWLPYYFNLYGYQYPHYLSSTHVEMFTSLASISGGQPTDGYWHTGDRLYVINPSSNIGYICTIAGYGCVGAWQHSTAYTAGQQFYNGTNAYQCTTAGTSASSGSGPTGTSSSIVDGTCVWEYLGVATVFVSFQ